MSCLHCGKDEEKYCEECYQELISENIKMQRQIKIKDEYMKLLCNVLFDYDGCYDPKTQEGNMKDLIELIDYTVELLKGAINSDDKMRVYFSGKGDKNILGELVER